MLSDTKKGSEVVVVKVELLAGFLVVDELNTSLLVVAHTAFEEVGLALQRDHIHPLERVLYVEVLGHSEREQQAVSDKLYVLAHQTRVHSDELAGQRLSDEVVLDLNGFADNFKDSFVCKFVV